MMARAKQLFDIYWQYYDLTPDFEETDKEERTQWYRVACEEARLAEYNAIKWQAEIDRIKAEAATMVPRKHYTDAVKSLTVCQQQIETLMLELKRWNPTSMIAQDARVVLGLLEAIIDINPDMQDEEWKEREKAHKAEAERVRREAVVAQMWKVSGTAMDDSSIGAFSERLKWNKENIKGAVGKTYEP